MKSNAVKNKIKCIQGKQKLPLKPSHRDGKHQVPPQQISKMSRIKGFDENVSQLPLCINVFHHYVSFLNVVSQEVASHFYVFCSPMQNWILGWAYGTGAISHEGYTLVGHSIISHGLHYPKDLGVAATYSASLVDYATADYL
jgi:hypothetical protein